MYTQHLTSCQGLISRLTCLSGNLLKVIAALCMLVDHFTKTTVTKVYIALEQAGQLPADTHVVFNHVLETILYPIGAIAFPLFCFLFVEGYRHTRNRKKYFCRLAVFALISEIPFDLTFFSGFVEINGTYPFYWHYQNVMFTFLLGMITLLLIDKAGHIPRKWPAMLIQAGIVTAMCCIAEFFIHADYEGYGVFLIVLFYVLRKNRLLQVLGPLAAMLVVYNPYPVSMVVSMLLILLYNGQRGKWKQKYFFYWFYPGHMVGLLLLNALLGI